MCINGTMSNSNFDQPFSEDVLHLGLPDLELAQFVEVDLVDRAARRESKFDEHRAAIERHQRGR